MKIEKQLNNNIINIPYYWKSYKDHKNIHSLYLGETRVGDIFTRKNEINLFNLDTPFEYYDVSFHTYKRNSNRWLDHFNPPDLNFTDLSTAKEVLLELAISQTFNESLFEKEIFNKETYYKKKTL